MWVWGGVGAPARLFAAAAVVVQEVANDIIAEGVFSRTCANHGRIFGNQIRLWLLGLLHLVAGKSLHDLFDHGLTGLGIGRCARGRIKCARCASVGQAAANLLIACGGGGTPRVVHWGGCCTWHRRRAHGGNKRVDHASFLRLGEVGCQVLGGREGGRRRRSLVGQGAVGGEGRGVVVGPGL